ncbi:hypothetical protein [Mycobacterium sp. SMC-13]|uniref:hypothetical protein n=1 Tax=Mycobacterium sp. SMC-13 TaxID=3381626 RepID=UPI003876EDC8
MIAHRTRMFARVLGPYLVVAAASLVTRADYVKTLLHTFGDKGLLHDQVTVSVTRPDWPVWS